MKITPFVENIQLDEPMLLVSFGDQLAHFRGYFVTDNEMEDITIYEFQVK